MNRVITPGGIKPLGIKQSVWLVFLFTGMSAAALACAGLACASKTAGSVQGHTSIAINQAATLFCCAAILGPGTHSEATPAPPVLSRFVGSEPELSLAVPGNDSPFSLGSAKRNHFGGLSARKV
jgi:hypothetical protein